MIAALLAFLYFRFGHAHCFDFEIAGYWQFVWITGFTAVTWIAITLITPPDDEGTLRRFYQLAKPGGPGWQAVVARAEAEGQPIDDGPGWSVPSGPLCTMFGCLSVYCGLFGTGYTLSGHVIIAGALLAVSATSMILVAVIWRKALDT